MKLCIECKHCRIPQVFGEPAPEYARCLAVPMGPAPAHAVNGEISNRYCTFVRMEGELCGPKAKLFEPGFGLADDPETREIEKVLG